MIRAAGAGLFLAASLGLAGPAGARADALPARGEVGEPPVAYLVRPGDTLIGLARSYMNRPGDYRAVQKANRVAEPRRLRQGSQLNIDPNLLKATPIAAALSAFTGPVQIEINGRRAAARVGMPLAEGQTVITGPGAFATFELDDGSRVTLPSNTRVRIARLRQVLINNAPQRVFQLDQGKGVISATPTQTPGARFEVRTPVSVSAVRGTEFRVGASGDKAQTEVLKGAVGVAAGQAAAGAPTIAAGFGVSAGAGGVGGPIELLPAPELAAGGQIQREPLVRFAAEPVKGAASYHLMLARDAGFMDVFAEANTQTTTRERAIADFGQVPNGDYFVRLTAIDPDGLEGLPADYAFHRDLGGSGDRPEAPRQYLFRWSGAGEGVGGYRFQLFAAKDPKTPIVDQPGLTEPRVTLTDLPPGDYVWRTITVRARDGVATETTAAPRALRIGG